MTTRMPPFETFQPLPEIPVIESLYYVRDRFDIGSAQQAAEILRLALLKKRVNGGEYFQLRVFEAPKEERETFLGGAASGRLNDKLNDPRLNSQSTVVNEKVMHAMILAACGLEVPRIQAQIHPLQRLGDIPAPVDAAELAAFLR